MSTAFDLTTFLSLLPFFMGADPTSVATIVGAAIRRTYSAGTTIFSEGEAASGLWIIEQGRVKIYKLSPLGGEHVLTFLGEGDTFNEIGALEASTNPANAAALSDVVVWVLPNETLLRVIQNDGRLALQVIRALATRTRMLVGQSETLALYSVVVRLARFLLQQTQDPSLSGPGITRTTIATHLATTPQTISIALRDLEQTGAIRFDRHHIVVEDESLLRSIAMIE